MSMGPLARFVIGGTFGFLAATGVFEAVDRFGDHQLPPQAEAAVAGRADFVRYCARDGRGMEAVRLSDDASGWRCAGRVNGMFTSEEADPVAVCHWQYGAGVEAVLIVERRPDGWWCVEAVDG